MKKAILSIFMLLGAIYSNAQNGFSLPLQENLFHNIPDTGTSIIEGNVTNVPDGTIVNFWFYKDGDYLGEPADTIIGGKFRFERKIDKWARYFITVADAKDELAIRPEPGNTIRITGNSPYCAFWKAETYDPWLAEKNEYIAYRKEHISDYMNLKEENGELTAKVNRYFLDKASKEEKKKLQNQIDSICEKEISMYEEYVNAMYEFMKDRPYSEVYKEELREVTDHALHGGEEELITKARNLCAKVPLDDVKIFRSLFTRKRVLDVGDEMVDFTLFDHKGKQHHLTEFNGNGKYLLLEFCSKDSKRIHDSRPNDVLHELYNKYSKNLDIVTVNCDFDDVWNNPNFQCDPWNEWNDHNNSTAVMMRYTIMFDYVFLSPEGKILGFGKHENLKDKAKQHFVLNL